MAEIYKFFNSAPGDPRYYQASDFADLFGTLLSSGIVNTDGTPGISVHVEAGTLNTIVSPGKALIKGYPYENTTDKMLTHSIPEPTMDRIDRIVLRLDLRNSERNILLHVKAGAPSASPVAPTLQRDNFIYELSLAQIRVRANTVQLLASDLKDERLDQNLCGLVMWNPKVPTDQFQKQWDEFMKGIQDEGFASAVEFAQLKEEVANMELTASNVKTANGSNVETELSNLKLDTDNKINSVRDAIVSKGGSVSGNPPTASQLVDGVNSLIVSQPLQVPDGSNFSARHGAGTDKDGNYYIIESYAGAWSGAVYSPDMTLLKRYSVTVKAVRGVSPTRIAVEEATDQLSIRDWNKTLIANVSKSNLTYKLAMPLNEEAILYYNPSSNTYFLINFSGTILAQKAGGTSDNSLYFNKRGNFVIYEYANFFTKIDAKTKVLTTIQNNSTIRYLFDLTNW